MTSRKTLAVMAFLLPLTLSAMAAGPLLAGVLIEAGGLWGVFLLGAPLIALAVLAATRAPSCPTATATPRATS